MYLCDVCSCQEILRRNGRGQARQQLEAARQALRRAEVAGESEEQVAELQEGE
jgi:hypothetical protein